MSQKSNSKELFSTIRAILKQDIQFVYIILLYGVVVSLCSLAIPISIQALVNTVGFVNLSQPLIVLSLILLSVLLISSFFHALQIFMVDLFHRKLIARLGSEMSIRLFYMNPKTFIERNGVDLVNRFFDVFSFHKNLSHLMVDGFTIALQLIVGLIFISFYHPLFLAFTIFLLIALYLILVIWGPSAMKTSIEESKSKYDFINWLQEVVRSNTITQSMSNQNFLFEKSESFISSYIQKRKDHFRIYISQMGVLLILSAVTSAAIIALGGFLVIREQLSLGQLVAAEIIVTGILLNLAKSGRYFEVFYDLVASVSKIQELIETPVGKVGAPFSIDSNVSFTFSGVVSSLDKKKVKLDLDISPRDRIYVNVENAPCKDVFIDVLLQKQYPARGTILVNKSDYQRFLPQDMRGLVYVVRDPVAIEGTLRENVTMGRQDISDSKIYDLFDLFELTETLGSFKDGLETKVQHHGYPFWKNKLIRVDMIRGLLSEPKLIILTETFRLLDLDLQEKIIQYLSSDDRSWSLINFATKQVQQVHSYDKVYKLSWKGFST
jgi:putative ABC transport system ATP-binding protein